MSLNHQTNRFRLLLPATIGLCLVARLASATDKIEVYRVPKERPAAPAESSMPAGHPNIDGEGMGHSHASQAMPKVSYTTPEGWTDTGAGEMRVAGFTISATNGQTAQVAVTPLPGMAGKENLIVNMWRQQVGLSELSDEEAGQQLTAVDIGGEPGKMFDMNGQSAAGANIRIVTAMAHRGEMSWFYKLQGDDALVLAQKPNFISFLKSIKIEAAPVVEALPAGHPNLGGGGMPGAVTTAAPPEPRQGGPTWTVPAGWQEISGGQFLFAKFLLTGESGAKAAVNVSTSPGDGGGLAANVNRWRGQLGLPQWGESDLQKNLTEVTTASGKATFVAMSGTDARTGQATALVGAIVNSGGAAWFYKLMGDEKLVAAQKENFIQFVKGVKY